MLLRDASLSIWTDISLVWNVYLMCNKLDMNISRGVISNTCADEMKARLAIYNNY